LLVFATTNSYTRALATQPVTKSPQWSTGSGSATFILSNLRQNYIFKYYSQATRSVIASSNIVYVKADQPLQGHLALTVDPTEMRITWSTNSTEEPVVKYGLTPNQYEWTEVGKFEFNT
jgi:hypothetical protein